jgi:hypothetical protein
MSFVEDFSLDNKMLSKYINGRGHFHCIITPWDEKLFVVETNVYLFLLLHDSCVDSHFPTTP